MSVVVRYDEDSFNLVNRTHPGRLAGTNREPACRVPSWGTPLSEEASMRGRSVSHTGRYGEKLQQ